MNPQQARERLLQEQNNIVSLNYRQQGLFNFYSAALYQGDVNRVQELRDQILELVEMQLDAMASCTLLIRTIADFEGRL